MSAQWRHAEMVSRFSRPLARFRLCRMPISACRAPQGASFDVDKFVVPMGEGYCPYPVPLRAIHILRFLGSRGFKCRREHSIRGVARF